MSQILCSVLKVFQDFLHFSNDSMFIKKKNLKALIPKQNIGMDNLQQNHV